MMQKQQFLACVIREWAHEIQTESEIGFEFVDPDDKSSYRSSRISQQLDLSFQQNLDESDEEMNEDL